MLIVPLPNKTAQLCMQRMEGEKITLAGANTVAADAMLGASVTAVRLHFGGKAGEGWVGKVWQRSEGGVLIV